MPKRFPWIVLSADTAVASPTPETTHAPPPGSEPYSSGYDSVPASTDSYGYRYEPREAASQTADYDVRPYGSGYTPLGYRPTRGGKHRTGTGLSGLLLLELRLKAAELGVKGIIRMPRGQLVEAIQQRQGGSGAYGSTDYDAYDPYSSASRSSSYQAYETASQNTGYDAASFEYAYQGATQRSTDGYPVKETTYLDTGLIDVRQFDYPADDPYASDPYASPHEAASSELSDYLAMQDRLPDYTDGDLGATEIPREEASYGETSDPDSPRSGEVSRTTQLDADARSQEDAPSGTAARTPAREDRKRSRRRLLDVDAEREPVALRLAVLFLPREARRDWQEEQRCYLLDLPQGQARRAWIRSLMFGLPGLVLATRHRTAYRKGPA